MEQAIIIKTQITNMTIAIGKKNKPITIASMINIEANGMNKMELYIKAIAKQIAYIIASAHTFKKSIIFLIFPFYVFIEK